MLEFVVSALSRFLNSGLYMGYLFPVFALAFIATVPVVIRSFFRR